MALRPVSKDKVNKILESAGYKLEDSSEEPTKPETPETGKPAEGGGEQQQEGNNKAKEVAATASASDTSLKQAECGCSQRSMSEQDAASTSTKTPQKTTEETTAKIASAQSAAPSASASTAKPEVAPVATASAAPQVVNIDTTPIATAISDAFKNHEQKLLEQLSKELGVAGKRQESVAAAPTPSSRVDDSAAKAKTEAFNKMKEWFYGAAKRANVTPSYEWNVSKDEILRKYLGVGYDGTYPTTFEPTMRKVEAITVTGGDMPQYFSNQIHRIPGGRLPLNVRPYVNFVDLNEQDRANWYKIDGMDAATITEGTEPSAASQTVTKITATPAIRGVYQKVGYSQVENAPFDLVQAVQDQMALSLIDDEASDMLGTVYDAVSPTNWVNANTGGTISSDDVASMTFKRDGLVAAKRLIAQQGHDVRPGNLVLFMHPKAYQELLLDTNLNNYYQFATPDITARGVLESIYGVEIVVSDHVKAKTNATSNTYRNVLAVKGIAFGLASARDVTFEAQKRNELQQILITATQRVKSAVIDETATCRISSAQ